MLLVRLDDPLHELVADDVLVAELDERNAVDRGEDLAHLDQPGCLLPRQVDLRHVAGHDHLRAEAEPGQKHLHLLGRGVLRLVEDDEAVVERAPAHERERSHLDRAAFHGGVELLRIHRVVERVEERAHVRIDLREHVPREEAEPLSRLDRGAGEDDPADLPLRERRDRECDREVRLARPGGPDAEGDRAVADGVDVALLRHGLRRDLLAAVRPDDVGEDLAHVLGLVDGAEDGIDSAGAHFLAALDELDKLLDDRLRLSDLQVVTGEREAVAAQVDGAAEPVAEGIEHRVADARELRGYLVRDVQNRLHKPQCRGRYGAFLRALDGLEGLVASVTNMTPSPAYARVTNFGPPLHRLSYATLRSPTPLHARSRRTRGGSGHDRRPRPLDPADPGRAGARARGARRGQPDRQPAPGGRGPGPERATPARARQGEPAAERVPAPRCQREPQGRAEAAPDAALLALRERGTEHDRRHRRRAQPVAAHRPRRVGTGALESGRGAGTAGGQLRARGAGARAAAQAAEAAARAGRPRDRCEAADGRVGARAPEATARVDPHVDLAAPGAGGGARAGGQGRGGGTPES